MRDPSARSGESCARRRLRSRGGGGESRSTAKRAKKRGNWKSLDPSFFPSGRRQAPSPPCLCPLMPDLRLFLPPTRALGSLPDGRIGGETRERRDGGEKGRSFSSLFARGIVFLFGRRPVSRWRCWRKEEIGRGTSASARPCEHSKRPRPSRDGQNSALPCRFDGRRRILSRGTRRKSELGDGCFQTAGGDGIHQSSFSFLFIESIARKREQEHVAPGLRGARSWRPLARRAPRGAPSRSAVAPVVEGSGRCKARERPMFRAG